MRPPFGAHPHSSRSLLRFVCESGLCKVPNIIFQVACTDLNCHVAALRVSLHESILSTTPSKTGPTGITLRDFHFAFCLLMHCALETEVFSRHPPTRLDQEFPASNLS